MIARPDSGHTALHASRSVGSPGSGGHASLRGRALRLFVGVLLVMRASVAVAVNPTPVQLFYVPFPEDQLLQGLRAITGNNVPTNPMQTYISIAAIANNTIIYYDQWENGYDPDIANPLNLYSGGNPGGTQIWGDGNPANGAPPGVPSDVINAGTVIILSNAVNTTTLQSVIDFDGRDKLAATKTIAVTHTGWSTGPNTLLAGAVEVFDTNNWGTDFLAPVGVDIPDGTDHQMFEYSSLAIMAGEGGATIQIDADANGSFETTQPLLEGEPYFVNGNVKVGARVTSDRPVQVDILTGDIGSTYESRDSGLLPTDLWTSSSYTPVSTSAGPVQGINGTATTVWLYNPGPTSIAVDYTTRNGSGNLTTTTLTVPGGAHGGYLSQVIPDGYGAHFATSGAPFYAFSTTNSTDTDVNGNQAWDWGYTLIPQDSLTPQVLIGLGIGRDPTSGVNPNENGNPAWVTPVGNGDTAVRVYVDFDANPATGSLTDPNGNKYDVFYDLKELERAKIYDTTDRNQTGMLIYTLTPGVKLAAAWGQDPLTATASAPGLDVGTGVPPLPLFAAGKNGTLFTDNDGDGFVSPGDVLLYTIAITNISRAPVPDILLKDTLPADTTYVHNSTFFKNASNVTTQIPDDGSGTAFPLDGGGHVLDAVTALPVGGSYEVAFKVTIDSFPNLTPGTTEILNTCSVSAVGTTVPCQDRTSLNGCIGDFVWNDLNGDGVQDGGPEVGIPGTTLNLIRDANGNGVIDGGEAIIATQTTNGSGGYRFNGLLAGDYIVDVVDGTVPAGYVLTTANDPTAVTLAGGQCDLDVDFGYRNPCIPADCDDQNPCTDDTCAANGCVHTALVGALCRPANGDCDVAERCDATGNCPGDGFASPAVVCRSSAGVCDPPEQCTGNSASCPADAKSTGVCRGAAGVCDVAESCDGVGNNCPGNVFVPSSMVCRASAGDCDVAETCTGSSANCPSDHFANSNQICRAAAGVCDDAEKCTGSGASCPPDLKATGVCRAANGACDVAEQCDGATNDCPPDAFKPSTQQCRAANGVCDVAENCTGSGADCPADGFHGATPALECRPANGDCDVPESCDGTSRDCPSDGFAASTTACRQSAGVCDVAENCTGSSRNCPTDRFAPSSQVCRAATDVCDVPEACSGSAATCPPDGVATNAVVCRAATGQCDVAENCDGSNKTCPADQPAQPGTPCDDGDGCTVDDSCTGGVCGGAPRDCTDNNPCTIDSCNSVQNQFLCVYADCYGGPQNNQCPPGHLECIPNVCGNGVIDAANHETCDPPNPTPIPGVSPPQPTCRPNCTSCGDGVLQLNDLETCDDGNQVSGCDPERPTVPLDMCQTNCTAPICHDPAIIVNGRVLSRLSVHGRLVTDDDVDMTTRDFVLQLSDQTGHALFRNSIGAGAIEGSPAFGRFKFGSKEARTAGGIQMMRAKKLNGGYRITIKAYGDMSGATEHMVTHVFVQNREWSLVGHWLKTSNGWRFAD